MASRPDSLMVHGVDMTVANVAVERRAGEPALRVPGGFIRHCRSTRFSSIPRIVGTDRALIVSARTAADVGAAQSGRAQSAKWLTMSQPGSSPDQSGRIVSLGVDGEQPGTHRYQDVRHVKGSGGRLPGDGRGHALPGGRGGGATVVGSAAHSTGGVGRFRWVVRGSWCGFAYQTAARLLSDCYRRVVVFSFANFRDFRWATCWNFV